MRRRRSAHPGRSASSRSDARRRVALGALVATGVAFLLIAAAPASAAADATVSGRVVNTTRNRPVSGLEVTLHRVQGETEAAPSTAVTGRGGEFTFAGLEAGGGWSYRVMAEYEGAEYSTRVLRPDGGKQFGVTLDVYDPTDSTASLTQTDWVVWLDKEGNAAAVQQDVAFANDGDRSYVGSTQLPENRRGVVQLPVAPGARNFQHLGYFLQCCELTRRDSLWHTAALLPGITRGTVRYSVPSLSSLSFHVWLPTKNFSLLVPDGVEARSDRLDPAGRTTDSGVTYRVYSASDLKPGDTIEISITGMQAPGAPVLAIVLIVIGVAGAFASIAIRLLVVRRRPRRGKRGRGGRKGRRGREARPRAAHRAPAPEPAADEEEDAELLLEEIAALDLAFERGALDEETYRKVRETTKNRLLRLTGSETARESGR